VGEEVCVFVSSEALERIGGSRFEDSERPRCGLSHVCFELGEGIFFGRDAPVIEALDAPVELKELRGRRQHDRAALTCVVGRVPDLESPIGDQETPRL